MSMNNLKKMMKQKLELVVKMKQKLCMVGKMRLALWRTCQGPLNPNTIPRKRRTTTSISRKRAQNTNWPQNESEKRHGKDYDLLMEDPSRFVLNSAEGSSDYEEFDEPVRYSAFGLMLT
ncbi:hypothetical protein ACH5RR_032754 [Cinchona calisaya]|uniref:Uncharacterized protein n=1 Tax=Cinchona calisaya TaxID=153742 RepID=A0ABD2YJ00_9GENT